MEWTHLGLVQNFLGAQRNKVLQLNLQLKPAMWLPDMIQIKGSCLNDKYQVLCCFLKLFDQV